MKIWDILKAIEVEVEGQEQFKRVHWILGLSLLWVLEDQTSSPAFHSRFLPKPPQCCSRWFIYENYQICLASDKSLHWWQRFRIELSVSFFLLLFDIANNGLLLKGYLVESLADFLKFWVCIGFKINRQSKPRISSYGSSQYLCELVSDRGTLQTSDSEVEAKCVQFPSSSCQQKLSCLCFWSY